MTSLAHVVKFSAGRASGVTDALVVEEHGPHAVERLFADTLIEDNDAYRFLIEWGGMVEGVAVGDLLRNAAALPEVWLDEKGRKAALADLRDKATARLRRLHWIADGRHPFEVFTAERMMGSSRMDPCSRALKRTLSDRYVRDRWLPESTVLYFGIAYYERHRHLGRWVTGKRGAEFKPGVRDLMLPWAARAPLIDRPDLTKSAMLGYLRSAGVEPPRLYALGYGNNNCGGACVKAGHASWLRLLRLNRPYFLWWEAKEQEFRRLPGISSRASILRDRRGGTTRPLTLHTLRVREERGEDLTHLLVSSDEGCGGGCALPA